MTALQQRVNQPQFMGKEKLFLNSVFFFFFSVSLELLYRINIVKKLEKQFCDYFDYLLGLISRRS